MENVFYVYAHVSEKTGDVFYIGKGKDQRAYVDVGRTKFWKNKVKSHGLFVQIVRDNLSEDDAFRIEADLIDGLGRRDLGKGHLLNLTDGGEGTANPSPETRRKQSLASRGNKYSLGRVMPEWEKQKRSASNLGKVRTRRMRENIGAAKIGRKNPNFNSTKYKFVHEDGRVMHCTQNELKSTMINDGVPASIRRGVSEMARGVRRQSAGWYLNEVKGVKKRGGVTEREKHWMFNPQVNVYQHESGEVFKGVQLDFRKKYNLAQGAVSQVTSGKRNIVKGWRLLEADVR